MLTYPIYFSPLTQGAWDGRLVHLSGTDTIGATAGSLSRLTQHREVELWEGKRIVAEMQEQEVGPIRERSIINNP